MVGHVHVNDCESLSSRASSSGCLRVKDFHLVAAQYAPGRLFMHILEFLHLNDIS